MTKSTAIYQDEPYYPDRMIMQWHITERCNLACKHCYQESPPPKELTYDQLLGIVEQYKEFISQVRQHKKNTVWARITVTGGEPFIRKDFFKLLEVFRQNRKLFSYSILSNGSFIDKSSVKELASLKPGYVQLSIDGKRETHDKIRGEGDYDKTVKALRLLIKQKIPALISFTAHKDNYREFAHVARLGSKLGATRVWTDRLIPHGRGALMQTLSSDEAQELFNIAQKIRTGVFHRWFRNTDVALHRALQFLVSDCYPYKCSAGEKLITVQANGDLVPCRRMPVKVGNLLETPLTELYQNSAFFKALRNPENTASECIGCQYEKQCNGGLKCLSFAVNGTPFSKDPACWI